MRFVSKAWRMPRPAASRLGHLLIAASAVMAGALSAATLPSYYAHEAVHDQYGVIAPWYQGLNGQLDERVNIAINVYKRYPWVDKPKAVMAAPDFVYNSHWSIKPDGTIVIPPTTDWMCGDLCARAWSIIKGLTAYYQYSGDPIAFMYIPLAVDYILDYGLTDELGLAALSHQHAHARQGLRQVRSRRPQPTRPLRHYRHRGAARLQTHRQLPAT